MFYDSFPQLTAGLREAMHTTTLYQCLSGLAVLPAHVPISATVANRWLPNEKNTTLKQ